MKSFCFLLFCFISLHVSYGCKQFSKQNVTFHSVNFIFTLQWGTAGLTPDSVFSVQYKRYGDKEWSIKHECQNISWNFCNLTNEISGDVDQMTNSGYYGRVRALHKNCSSDWVMSKRLHPIEDTHIGQPEINYFQDVHSLEIVVSAPYIPVKNKDGHPQKMQDLYSNMFLQYHVSLSSLKLLDMWKKSQANNTFEVAGLIPNTKYYGSAYILIENRRKSDIRHFVVQTLPDQVFFTLIVCGFAVSAGFIITGLLYFFYRYINLKERSPKSLKIPGKASFQPVYVFKDYDLNKVSLGEPASTTLSLDAARINKPQNQEDPENIIYKAQLQSPTKNSPYLKSSYCEQQKSNLETNNKIDYGIIEGRISNRKHNCNHLPNYCLSKMNAQSNAPCSSINCMNCNDGNEKDTGGLRVDEQSVTPPKSFSFGKTETVYLNSYNQHSLLSTVKVCDWLEWPVDQTEEPALHLSQNSNNLHKVLEMQLQSQELLQGVLPSCTKTYTSQNPFNPIASQMERTCFLQEPYRMQHSSEFV